MQLIFNVPDWVRSVGDRACIQERLRTGRRLTHEEWLTSVILDAVERLKHAPGGPAAVAAIQTGQRLAESPTEANPPEGGETK